MIKNLYIKYKNIIKLIILFILFYNSHIFAYIPIYILNIDINDISTEMSSLLNIFSSLCVLIILLIVYRKDLINYCRKIKGKTLKVLDNSLKYYLIGLIIMMASNLLLTIVFKSNGATNEKIVQSMISTSPFIMFINAGIIAPIVEELIFRKSFMDVFKNKWLFILISGFVFGLLHVITSAETLVEYLYLIPYGALGVGLALMDYKEDNILPSIFYHMAHNSILILLSILA